MTWHGLHLGHFLKGPEQGRLGMASQLLSSHQERGKEAGTSNALLTLMTEV